MPYGYGNQGYGGGLGMGYNAGTMIPMMGVKPDMTGYAQQAQDLAQSQQTMQIQGQNAANFNALAQQEIQTGQANLEDAQNDRQTKNDLTNMIQQSYTKTPIAPSTAPSTAPNSPQGQGQASGSVSPTPKNPDTGLPLNTHPDTSKAIDPDNPSFASTHTWNSVDPQTGAGFANTFDRQGLFDKMMNYTDSKGGHPLASKANDMLSQWQQSDAGDEKTKQDAIVQQNARLLGQVAGFSYLRPDQQANSYARFKNEVESQQPGATSNWPTDITSKEGQAWLANEQRQAEVNVNTATNASKMAEDALKKAQTATQPSVSFKNTAEGIKALADAAKAKQEAQAGGAGVVPAGFPTSELTGPDYRKLLNPAQLNWVSGLASGEVKLSTNRKEAQAQMAAAKQAFPDTNIEGAQKWQRDMASEQPGTSGGVKTGAIKTFGHMGSMMQSDNEGTQVGGLPIWAVPLNYIGNSTSVSAGNAEAGWNTEHTALVNEVEKQFKGTGAAAAEAFRDMKNLKFTDSPSRKKRVYQAYSDLMSGLTDAVESQRRQILGDDLDPGVSILDNKSQEVIKSVHGGRLPSGTLPAFDANGRVGTKVPRSLQGGVSSLNGTQAPPGAQAPTAPTLPPGHTVQSVTAEAQAAINSGAPIDQVIKFSKDTYGVDLTGKVR